MSGQVQRISVVGLGKLGLCTAACLARGGYHVVGVDVNHDHVRAIAAGRTSFAEAGLAELLAEVRERLEVTTDAAHAVRETDATFIIVPTPSLPDGGFSNEYVLDALRAMAPALRDKASATVADGTGARPRHVVNLVSTVMPGSCTSEFIPFLERETGLECGTDFGFGYNPEFIAIGSVINDFLNPDLVLVGESGPATGAALESIYRAVCDNEPHIARTSLVNAEIAKLSINCFCTMKISFANTLAQVCEPVGGADAREVASIIGHDSRIGHKYVTPGLGFGGPCFPRDNEAFIRFAGDHGGEATLQRAVVAVNNAQPARVAGRIVHAARAAGRGNGNGSGNGADAKPKKIALLGLSYKPYTGLVERSQALDVALYLARNHPELTIVAYDPMARSNGLWRLAESLEECVRGADVAAVLTPWPQFRDQGWRSLLAEGGRILNFWD